MLHHDGMQVYKPTCPEAGEGWIGFALAGRVNHQKDARRVWWASEGLGCGRLARPKQLATSISHCWQHTVQYLVSAAESIRGNATSSKGDNPPSLRVCTYEPIHKSF